MKRLPIYPFLLLMIFVSCQRQPQKNSHILIESKIADTVKNNIILFPDEEISYFKTKRFSKFYVEDKLTGTINGDSSSMMSWYSIRHDTIDMVVHPGDYFGTTSLLVRFIKDSIIVMLLRAVDNPRPAFKLNQKDTFANFVEVPAKKYQLKLSAIPNAKTKQPIYGFIDMESEDYHTKNESSESETEKNSTETKNRDWIKFYFRSHIFILSLQIKLLQTLRPTQPAYYIYSYTQ